MVDSKRVITTTQFVRVWVHECSRIFADRLTCEEDHTWLQVLLKAKVEKVFGMSWDDVIPTAGNNAQDVVFCDFMDKSKLLLSESK